MNIYLIEIMMFGLAVFFVALFIEKIQSRRHLNDQRQLVLAFHEQLEAARKDVAAALQAADALGDYELKERGGR